MASRCPRGAPLTESQLWILCVFGICEMRSHAHLNQSLSQIGFLLFLCFYDGERCRYHSGLGDRRAAMLLNCTDIVSIWHLASLIHAKSPEDYVHKHTLRLHVYYNLGVYSAIGSNATSWGLGKVGDKSLLQWMQWRMWSRWDHLVLNISDTSAFCFLFLLSSKWPENLLKGKSLPNGRNRQMELVR